MKKHRTLPLLLSTSATAVLLAFYLNAQAPTQTKSLMWVNPSNAAFYWQVDDGSVATFCKLQPVISRKKRQMFEILTVRKKEIISQGIVYPRQTKPKFLHSVNFITNQPVKINLLPTCMKSLSGKFFIVLYDPEYSV